ncbi:hypothetical protein QBC43DRAFT_48652 [Cladorrhinum sp. PSN259]|nr:hypothetical protein QBC43DRAFT_48652 [Cladorrhinum sp. PSN259]
MAAANIGMTEPGHTKFNLSYPLVPSGNYTESAEESSLSSSTSGTLLLSIHIPHSLTTLILLLRILSRFLVTSPSSPTTRRWRKLTWHPSDTLIVISYAFSTAITILYSLSPLTPLHTYLALIFHQSTLLLTKLSILAFYLRVFNTAGNRTEKRICVGTILFCLGYGVPLIAIAALQCSSSSLLLPAVSGATKKCFTFEELLISGTTLHSLADLWLVLLILPTVVRLKGLLPPRQRAAVGIVLSLGLFVVAACLTRALVVLQEGEENALLRGEAFYVLTVLEVDVAILVACAPMMRVCLGVVWPRFVHYSPRRGGGGRRDRNRNGGGSIESGSERSSSLDFDERRAGGSTRSGLSGSFRTTWEQRHMTTATRASSKNASVTNLYFNGAVTAPPIPPPALILSSSSHRTPTTLSLRSFMTMPRSRGNTVSFVAGDRKGLLVGEGDFAVIDREEEGSKTRRSSVGFEGYYDQYIGYNTEHDKRMSWRSTGQSNRGSRCYSGDKWQDSQESFVLGLNDPNSPTVSRFSPVSSESTVFGESSVQTPRPGSIITKDGRPGTSGKGKGNDGSVG